MVEIFSEGDTGAGECGCIWTRLLESTFVLNWYSYVDCDEDEEKC